MGTEDSSEHTSRTVVVAAEESVKNEFVILLSYPPQPPYPFPLSRNIYLLQRLGCSPIRGREAGGSESGIRDGSGEKSMKVGEVESERVGGLGFGEHIRRLDLGCVGSAYGLYVVSVCCPKLSTLSLEGAGWVNGAGVVRVVRVCEELREVGLRGTGIGREDEQMKALLEGRRGLKIVW